MLIVTWGAELTSRTICDGLPTQSLGERNFAHVEQSMWMGFWRITEAEIRAAMRVIVATARLVPEPRRRGDDGGAAVLRGRAAAVPQAVATERRQRGSKLLAEVLTESTS